MKMYAKTYAKMDILNLMNFINVWRVITRHTSMENLRQKGDETSWNTEDHVVCPSCKSFDYYILKENEDE
jgi:hypothetical protein